MSVLTCIGISSTLYHMSVLYVKYKVAKFCLPEIYVEFLVMSISYTFLINCGLVATFPRLII